MPDQMTQFLIDRYQESRDEANMLAHELEARGYQGFYIVKGESGGAWYEDGPNQKKPLDPTTGPTQFIWEKKS